jgi:hypothetical protein
MYGGNEKWYNISVVKPRTLGHRGKDNIKMYLEDTMCGGGLD